MEQSKTAQRDKGWDRNWIFYFLEPDPRTRLAEEFGVGWEAGLQYINVCIYHQDPCILMTSISKRFVSVYGIAKRRSVIDLHYIQLCNVGMRWDDDEEENVQRV